MDRSNCHLVTHHTRNGVLALMGQMIVLKSRLKRLGVMDQVDLSNLEAQINRIGKAIDKCRPACHEFDHDWK